MSTEQNSILDSELCDAIKKIDSIESKYIRCTMMEYLVSMLLDYNIDMLSKWAYQSEAVSEALRILKE